LAISDSRDAFGVLLASGPLVGTLLLNTLLDVSNLSDCSGNGIQAIVVNDAFPESSGIGVTLFGKAGSVAGSGVAALFLTVLKSGKAFGVSLACVELVSAVLFNALLRGGEDQSS
jgi:hypothetical protein